MKDRTIEFNELIQLLSKAHLKASQLDLQYTCHKLGFIVDNVKTSKMIHQFELDEKKRIKGYEESDNNPTFRGNPK